MGEPIVALATPPLKSALAVVRASGDDLVSIASRLFSRNLGKIDRRSSFVGYFLTPDGEKIDQVVLLAYPPSSSMNGEETVEIICHGNPLISEKIIDSLLHSGCRYAKNGEFTARAYFNGKLDLVEAEAVRSLIEASSNEARRLALMSLEGRASALLSPVKERLAALLSSFEVGFDFPEYEEEAALDIEKAKREIESVQGALSGLIDEGTEGSFISSGLKVAIVGEPNVGKSTILNALLNEDKAIVSDIPGTTRDVVEGSVNYKGLSFVFLDTAGLRDNPEAIEKIGIEKSLLSIESSDAVVLVLEDDRPLSEKEQEVEEKAKGKIFVVVVNKTDLRSESKPQDGRRVYISARNKEREPLLKALWERAKISSGAFTRPSLSSPRELALLKEARQALFDAKKALDEGNIDLCSSAVFSSYNEIKQVLGEETSLDLSEEIFSRFCVGK